MGKSVEQFLVRELSKGSVKAFNHLYEKYCDRLFCFAFLLLNKHDGAEEAVQNVFLKIWEKRDALNPDLSFQAYIFKITKNYVYKLISQSLNKKTKINEFIYHSANSIESESIDMTISELKEKARREITNLPCQRKRVFIMRRSLNMTNIEISEKLDISVHTVKRHMNLALRSLDRALING